MTRAKSKLGSKEIIKNGKFDGMDSKDVCKINGKLNQIKCEHAFKEQ